MYFSKEHLQWIKFNGEVLYTVNRKEIKIWDFRPTNDEKILSSWARHFRNHYCSDDEIDSLILGTPYSKTEYLEKIKFPDKKNPPGPSIRAGDFCEILVTDYLEYIQNFWVPRLRFSNKDVRNESTQGTDILGFKIFDPEIESTNDVLAIFEAKAQLVGQLKKSRLQDAIDDSAKDQIRKAESLNFLKQQFLNQKKFDLVKRIARFQNPEDHPYYEFSGAAVLISTHLFDQDQLSSSTSENHPNCENLHLLIIRGDSLMDIVNSLYKRAADEA
jgi:hypothetical protein